MTMGEKKILARVTSKGYSKHWYFSLENVFGLPQKPFLWQKKPEGTSSVFNVGTAAKCCEFKRYVFRLDSMLRESSEPVTRVTGDINTGVRTVAKTMVVDWEKKPKALALLRLA